MSRIPLLSTHYGRRTRNAGALLLAALVLAAACAGASRAEGSRASRSDPASQTVQSKTRENPGSVEPRNTDLARGASATAVHGRPTAEEMASGVLWRFHVGAPLPGAPATARDGRVYAAGTDGYVHALDAEGAFRWSYTVTGRVVGAPHLDAAGRLYLATAANRVYSLTGSGGKWWLFNTPASPVSGVAVGPDGLVYFAGADRHLWALSPKAVVLWRAKIRGTLIGAPVPARQGVAIGTSTGTISVIRSQSRRWDVELGEAIADEPIVDDAALYAIAGTKLVALQMGNAVPRWTRQGSAFVAKADGGHVVVIGVDGSAAFVSAVDGKELSKSSVGRASAVPVIDGDLAFVPCDDGALRVVRAGSGVIGTIAVARAPLLAPSIAAGRVVVSAGDGTIAGIDATRWRRNGS